MTKELKSNTLKISTWNVNSVKARIGLFTKWLKEVSPDVVLMQELKCLEKDFPKEQVEELGYNVYVNGQKTYNGVAILSKYPVEDIVSELPRYNIEKQEDKETRYLEGLVLVDGEVIRVATVYVPNGGVTHMPDDKEVNETERFQYKMRFYERLKRRFSELLKYNEVSIFAGDYNVCPEIFDMHNPKKDGSVCCHIDERVKFRSLQNIGLTEAWRALNPDIQEFSWWDYRARGWENDKGLRLDHVLVSPMAMDRITKCYIESDLRAKTKPSDHAPVTCELNL